MRAVRRGRGDHGAHSLAGEDLEQQGVRLPAVEDVGLGDAAADGPHARPDLGDHAAVDRAVGQHGARARRSWRRDRRVAGSCAVRPDAVDVGQIDELVGAERLGDGAGGGVGVDVVGLARWRRCRWWRRPG